MEVKIATESMVAESSVHQEPLFVAGSHVAKKTMAEDHLINRKTNIKKKLNISHEKHPSTFHL